MVLVTEFNTLVISERKNTTGATQGKNNGKMMKIGKMNRTLAYSANYYMHRTLVIPTLKTLYFQYGLENKTKGLR